MSATAGEFIRLTVDTVWCVADNGKYKRGGDAEPETLVIFAADVNPPPAPAGPLLSGQNAILFTLLGSLVVILLEGVKYAKLPKAQRPNQWDLFYWLNLLVFNPLFAFIAGLVCVYGGQPLTSYTALALGAGAPVFVKRVIDAVAPAPSTPPTPLGA